MTDYEIAINDTGYTLKTRTGALRSVECAGEGVAVLSIAVEDLLGKVLEARRNPADFSVTVLVGTPLAAIAASVRVMAVLTRFGVVRFEVAG